MNATLFTMAKVEGNKLSAYYILLRPDKVSSLFHRADLPNSHSELSSYVHSKLVND